MTTNKMQLLLNYLFLGCSTCFGRFLRPSSGAYNCTYSFGYCQPVLLLAGIMNGMELQAVPSLYVLNISRVKYFSEF
jgi:hypothetical protein